MAAQVHASRHLLAYDLNQHSARALVFATARVLHQLYRSPHTNQHADLSRLIKRLSLPSCQPAASASMVTDSVTAWDYMCNNIWGCRNTNLILRTEWRDRGTGAGTRGLKAVFDERQINNTQLTIV